MRTVRVDEERDPGAETIGAPAPDGLAAPGYEMLQRTLAEDRDRLARRVDVLTTRIALMAERERRAGGRLVESEVRAARAEELAERRHEQIAEGEKRIRALEERIREGEERNVELELRAARAEALAGRQHEHIEAIQQTVSWRITAPLRRVRALRRG